MLSLPNDPTPEQLQAVALASIRAAFESDASDLRDLAPLDSDGWQAVYTAEGRDFTIQYRRGEFVKFPVGGGQDG